MAEGNLSGYKSMLRSKTVWLALIAALSALPKIGAHVGALDPELLASSAGALLDTIAAVSALLAAYTRTTATKKIGGVTEGSGR